MPNTYSNTKFSTGRSFPRKDIPETEKDEKWYKDYVLAIMQNSLDGNFSLVRTIMSDNYDFFNGTQTGDEFNFLQQSEDGKESLPAIWINFNKIRNKVNLLIGDLISRGFEISVRSINQEAETKKMDFKKRTLTEMKMREINKELLESAGFGQLVSEQPIPESLEELNDFMKYSYKSNEELIIETALKYNIKLYQWKYKRLHLFRNVVITGRVFAKNEIRNGYPQIRMLDPRNVVFDPYATDDFLTDASYFGEVRYMSIEDAAEQYGISEKDIKDLYEYGKKGGEKLSWFGVMDYSGSGYVFSNFEKINDETRILVFSAQWYDYKKVRYKVSVDNYGNEHLKDVEKGEKGKDIEERIIITIRQATLLGGEKLVEWGEAANQPRDIDNPSVTRLGYVSLIPNYVNFKGVSKVEELKGLQKLKDVIMYRIQLEVATAGRKGVAYDIAKLPDQMDIEKVMYYLKVAGITFYDSGKEGMPTGSAPIHTIDSSLSQSVQLYLNLSMMIDNEMDSVSGINEARQGQVMGSSQLVGVTQASLTQSGIITESLFELFTQFEQRIFQGHADLIKIAWVDKDKFSPILGELGFDFLQQDIDVDLDDYAVFVEPIPHVLENKQRLTEMVMAALQSGKLSFPDALDLLIEKDIRRGIRKFTKRVEQREQDEKEFALTQQQLAGEQAAASEQAKQASEKDRQMAEHTTAETTERLKNARDMSRTLTKTSAEREENEKDRELKLFIEELKRRGAGAPV